MAASDEQINQILNNLKSLQSDVSELRLYVAGDKLKQVVGMVDILETHRQQIQETRREIFGDETIKHIGLKQRSEDDHRRIRSLESDKTKVIAYGTAASVVVSIVASVVRWFWPKAP